MNSKDYWAKREAENLKHCIKEEKEFDKRLQEIYKNMLEACQNEINAFYGRYASKEGISIAEAKKRVSQLDIKRYERKAKRYVKEKNFSAEANEEMRLYNLAMKVNRLEMLKANIGLELIAGHNEMQKFMEEILQGRTEDELKRQAGILGESVKNNAKTASTIVNASFHNAKFNDRIWLYQNLLKAEVDKLLQSGMIQGKNPRVLARELEKKFGVSKYNAERLMRTELARVQTEAQKESFIRNGFDMYTFHVNGGCCPICEGIAKENGGHYKVKDMMPGTNAPPMHPHCRCSTSAYEDSDEYEAWLDYVSKGGTTAEWEKLQTEKKKTPVNKNGEDIIFDESLNDEAWKKSVEILKTLADEYESNLINVRMFRKGENTSFAAGDCSPFGIMRLSSRKPETAIHEFAHSLSSTGRKKLGLEADEDFWKEIRKIRTAYNKHVRENPQDKISYYVVESVDEFFAEAFTVAKGKQMGIELPDHYGENLEYPMQVLNVVDKYFKKKR